LNLERKLFVALITGKLLDAEVNGVDVLGQVVLSVELLVAPVARMLHNDVNICNVGFEAGFILKHPFTNVAGPETKNNNSSIAFVFWEMLMSS
jgi:hypothetical protein